VWIDIQAPHHLSHLLLLTVDAVAVGKLAHGNSPPGWVRPPVIVRASLCDMRQRLLMQINVKGGYAPASALRPGRKSPA
jgi:hypothetical protein